MHLLGASKALSNSVGYLVSATGVFLCLAFCACRRELEQWRQCWPLGVESEQCCVECELEHWLADFFIVLNIDKLILDSVATWQELYDGGIG